MKVRNLERVRELKDEGHAIIDQLVKRTGKKKSQIYLDLQQKLGLTLESSAHFSNMFTLREVERAVTALREMLPATQMSKKVKNRVTNTLPLSEQRKILRGLERKRTFGVYLPVLSWRRVILWRVGIGK